MYVNGVFSDSLVMSSGVPRWSILGPLLSLIYINMVKATNYFSLRLLAQNMSLTATGRDLDH